MTGPPVTDTETPLERYRRLYGGGAAADAARAALSPAAQAYAARFAGTKAPAPVEISAPPPRSRSGFLDRVRGTLKKAGQDVEALTGAGALETILQTINPFQDELTGVVQAAGALMPGGRSPREALVQEMNASRARIAQFAEDDPAGSALATGTGIAGILAAGPARAAAKAFPMALKGVKGSLQAAGVGGGKAAAFAAPYYLGAAEGTLSERLPQTVKGTAFAFGLGSVLGPVANRLSRRSPQRGSLAEAAEIGGTNLGQAVADRAALTPTVRATTPALTHVGPAETALVNRTIRTRKGAKLGRVVEQRLNTLDEQLQEVGDAKGAMFEVPTIVDDPAILESLRAAREFPAFEKVVKATQKDLAGGNKFVGDITKKFKGTVEEALAAGIPEADIIARSALPDGMRMLLRGNAQGRAGALATPVAKGFTHTESHPYTLEFFDRLQRTARKVLEKDYGSGGSATTDLVEKINKSLVDQARQLFPRYDAIQTEYGQLTTALEQLEKRVSPVFEAAAKRGRRYTITAHPTAPGMLSTQFARAAATPLSAGGQAQAAIGTLREVPRFFTRNAERKATVDLLKTGAAGDDLLFGLLVGSPGRKIPAGAFRLPGLLSAPSTGTEEERFRGWYAGWAGKAGLDPDPDNPLHRYDYRAAFRAGAKPKIDPGDGLYHWPSQYKADDHPNRFVGGVDTKATRP